MMEFFATWWPFMVLLALPSLVRRIMYAVITRMFLRLDKSHPDDLPQTAGEWLADEIKRTGLNYRIRTVVTDKEAKFSTDAYHPLDDTIQLSAETHFKRDPMHWAVAAHELGHARFKHALPRFARFTLIARYAQQLSLSTGCGLLLGNVAFALPHVTNLAFLIFAVSATFALVKLVDEMAASIYAMQSLRASPVYAWSHLRSARIMLTLAFSTYLVWFLSNTLLLTQWHRVEELTRTPLVPPLAQLTAFGFVLAAVLSIILIVFPLLKLIEDSKPRATETDRKALVHGLRSLALIVAVPAFALLVYDVRADHNWAYFVMASLVYGHGLFGVVLFGPYMVVDSLVLNRVFRKLTVDPTHRSREFLRDHDAGKQQRAAGNRTLGDIIDRINLSPPVEFKLSRLVYLFHLPLVIAFWLT